MIVWIGAYLAVGVILAAVMGVLLIDSDRYCLSEIITICVGIVLLWYIVFPVQLYGYCYYRPKHKQLNCCMLRRLRRKARRQIKDVKKAHSLGLMYKPYDGKLYVVGSRVYLSLRDLSQTIEAFRRQWILQEIKNMRKRRHIGAHIGPME